MTKFLIMAVALAATLVAAPSKCTNGSYFGGEAPDILNVKLTSKARELCSSEFSVIYSGIARAPLAVGEHLLASNLSTKIERTDDFHPDLRIPEDERAELSDWSRSGYDRGHLANARDMHTEQGEHESFALSNMLMQNPENNRNLFSDLEQATRGLAKKEGELYVISGPLFIGNDLKRVNGRVLVPTKIFKAIYCPKKGQGAAFIVNNAPGENYEVVSIAKIEEITGIRLFPKMSATSKQTAMELPAAIGSNFGGRSDHNALATKPYKAPAANVTVSTQCGSKRVCREMNSCEEAMFYLNTCGISSLDGNHDGIPCSKLCK